MDDGQPTPETDCDAESRARQRRPHSAIAPSSHPDPEDLPEEPDEEPVPDGQYEPL